MSTFSNFRSRSLRNREAILTQPLLVTMHQYRQKALGSYKKTHTQSPPLFVLSTGRCGTQTLEDFLNLSSHIAAFYDNTSSDVVPSHSLDFNFKHILKPSGKFHNDPLHDRYFLDLIAIKAAYFIQHQMSHGFGRKHKTLSCTFVATYTDQG